MSTNRVDLVALVQSDHAELRRMAVFDALINNADRKGGHVLPTADGHLGASTTASPSQSRTSFEPCCGNGAVNMFPDDLFGDLSMMVDDLGTTVSIRRLLS